MPTATRARKSPPKAAQPALRATRLRRVFVRDLEIVASIGVYEHEKRYEQRVLIWADLWVRDDYDGVSDRLSDVVDYGKVVDDIVVLVQSEHVHLIETMAERIARQCLSDRRVERVGCASRRPTWPTPSRGSASRSSAGEADLSLFSTASGQNRRVDRRRRAAVACSLFLDALAARPHRLPWHRLHGRG